ncbi:MAG: hypothetical protein EBZ72_06430, partial [Burkholderiaceae bacterium]|nr:hypothetical protein [Burkholderiaceae bacterium]
FSPFPVGFSSTSAHMEGLPLVIHSERVQPRTAAAVANNVVANANAAVPFASKAEPALKPNQPNHKSDAPTMVYTRLCGFIAFKIADMVFGLRVKEEEEREGLDINSHGESAYET